MKTTGFLMIAMLLFLVACRDHNTATADSTPALPADTMSSPAPRAATKTILFFGNSLTAGYGVDPAQAFPALIADKIDSLQLPYKVINGGVSGETSAGGNQRIGFVLKQQPVDVFVLELGANDGLRGLPPAETKQNLQFIVDKVKQKYPEAKLVLAGMQIPPNMGQAYAAQFRDIYPALAKANHMTLIPFLLAGVGGETRLNQQDGIHPTAEGHRVVAETVWDQLKTVLQP